jgi:hypothetical protein
MNETNISLGVLLAILAGALNGTFALPMRLMKKWRCGSTHTRAIRQHGTVGWGMRSVECFC